MEIEDIGIENTEGEATDFDPLLIKLASLFSFAGGPILLADTLAEFFPK